MSEGEVEDKIREVMEPSCRSDLVGDYEELNFHSEWNKLGVFEQRSVML